MANFAESTFGVLLLGYLLGSIPFGVILTRLGGAGDVRAIGSGNIGATNVLRTGRKGLAVATLLLDLAKGLVAVWIAASLSPGNEQLAGAGAMLGHIYPFWLRFKGGKGVATFMGVALGLDLTTGFETWMGAIYAGLWIGTIMVTRLSSLGGLVAAISVPVSAWAFDRPDLVPLMAALAIIVLWKHQENIGRLLRGEEPRVGRSAPKVADG